MYTNFGQNYFTTITLFFVDVRGDCGMVNLTEGNEQMTVDTANRAELVLAFLDNLDEMVDAFIAAGIDPQDDATETEAIRAVIQQWVEDGDECGNC